jgi:hypothetical protein
LLIDIESVIAKTIIEQATVRGITKTICPSEVARKLWPEDWRKHMTDVRKTAFVLRDNGLIRIMQKGDEVVGNDVKGPLRIQIK